MAVSSKHILSQGPVIAGLGRTAFSALVQQIGGGGGELQLPSAELTATLKPRSAALVKDYVRAVGGDPSAYRETLPPHLFPQWGFGLASRTLKGIPYPMLKVMNGGCRLEVRAPLPNDEPLHVRASLQSIDDNGRRALLHQRIVTGTASAPDAIISDLYPIVPLGGGGKKSKKRPPRVVPQDARELAVWKLGKKAGLDFAKLTGDFNPVHWVPAYARASGFKSVILHGFATMARAMEGIRTHQLKGSGEVRVLDVQFTRPLVLPATVGLFVSDDGGVFVGDAPGGPAYMMGSFELA